MPRTRTHAPTPHPVATTDQIPDGGRLIVDLEGRSIGVFRVGNDFYALRNLCPHQGTPLCEGPVMDTTLPSSPGSYVFGLEGRVLRCPWHGWEFDVTTGRSLFAPEACRVRRYDTSVAVEAPDLAGPDAARAERFDVSVRASTVYVHV